MYLPFVDGDGFAIWTIRSNMSKPLTFKASRCLRDVFFGSILWRFYCGARFLGWWFVTVGIISGGGKRLV